MAETHEPTNPTPSERRRALLLRGGKLLATLANLAKLKEFAILSSASTPDELDELADAFLLASMPDGAVECRTSPTSPTSELAEALDPSPRVHEVNESAALRWPRLLEQVRSLRESAARYDEAERELGVSLERIGNLEAAIDEAKALAGQYGEQRDAALAARDQARSEADRHYERVAWLEAELEATRVGSDDDLLAMLKARLGGRRRSQQAGGRTGDRLGTSGAVLSLSSEVAERPAEHRRLARAVVAGIRRSKSLALAQAGKLPVLYREQRTRENGASYARVTMDCPERGRRCMEVHEYDDYTVAWAVDQLRTWPDKRFAYYVEVDGAPPWSGWPHRGSRPAPGTESEPTEDQ